MGAADLALALGGRRVGAGWMARCPVHDDRTPSLSIRATDSIKVLVHCHAGCGQEHVISALRGRGLWSEPWRRSLVTTVTPKPFGGRGGFDAVHRTDRALAIWRSATAASASLVATYLASRGLRFLPDVLRFHPKLKHPRGGYWPAMVALVTRGIDDIPMAVHRTFLAYDGTGKASVGPQKMMLGPCRGGAVRLAPLGNVLMVGEGIETCLAAMQESGLPAWAALSTSGLRALALPEEVRDVIVLADGDDAGEAAARDCALRWRREGRRVRIARPPRGMDFNDLLSGAHAEPGRAHDE